MTSGKKVRMFAWIANLRTNRRLAIQRRWSEVNGPTLFNGVTAFQTDLPRARAIAESGVAHLERTHGEAEFPGLAARDLANAARLAGREDLAERVHARMKGAEPSGWSKVEQQYALLTPATMAEQLARHYVRERHLREALDRRFDLAMKSAIYPLWQEEVATVAALLGDLSEAERLRDELEVAERRASVHLLITISALWYGYTEEYERYLREVHPERNCWDYAHLTLGLLGRELWHGFQRCPFPDW
jgi:hypothetical protein